MRKLLTFLFICVAVYTRAQAICGGQTATLSAPNPSNLANPTYSLNPGGFAPINGNQFVVSPNVTSTFTLYTSGQGPSGQVTTSVTIQVTVNPQPVTTPTLIQPSCTSTITGFNLGLTFSPANPAPSYTIQWSSIPNGILSGQQTSVASGVVSGPYTYTITTNNNCQLINTISLSPVPAPANFTLNPFGSAYTLTCIQTSIDVTASEPAYDYTWTSTSSLPVNSQSINLNSGNIGTHTVIGKNLSSGCTRTFTFQLFQNISVPSSTVTPLMQAINCSLVAAATVSAYANPTINIGHYITDPLGGVFAANSHTAIYTVGPPGTYTHCLVNLESGCETCKTFTITSTEGYPTFSLSSPQNFTLGCGTKSVATINIVGAATQPTAGGAVSYTIIGPPTGTAIPIGSLSAQSSYTVNVPGTWTIIVKDNANNCQTRSQQSITQDIAPPNISVDEYLPVLTCDNPRTVLRGLSETPNVSAEWAFVNNPPIQPGFTVAANILTASPTSTLVNTFTLTLTDNNNACKSTTVVPIRQNIFVPNVGFALGTGSITCATPTIVLTNTSTSTIPPNVYPVTLPVTGWLWEGPSPQEPLQVSTTYVAGIQGTYTLTGKDLNNGCLGKATRFIDDFRDYPNVSFTHGTGPVELDCGAAGIITATVTNQASNAHSYFWPPTVPPTQTGQQGLRSSTVTAPGTYTVIVTNTVNSCVTTQTVAAVNASLNALLDAFPRRGYAPLEVNFTNNSKSVTNASITTVWNFGNGTYTTTPSTSVSPKTALATGNLSLTIPSATTDLKYTQPGTYKVVIRTTKGTCVDSAAIEIIVDMPSRLEVPNIFTPNGDGVNDVYFMKAFSMADIYFVIYDRWGNLVYELTSSTGNISWDGIAQTGKEAAEGVYYFVMTGTGSDGTEYKEKGTITLVR